MKTIPIEGLDENETRLVIEALTLLRKVRGDAWERDCDAAEKHGKRKPGLVRYEIDNIKRLARRFGGRALHWMEGEAAINYRYFPFSNVFRE